MATKRTGQNLVELRPGYWKVTVNIPAGESPDGKRHRRVAYVTGGKRAAEQKRRDLLGQRDQGKLKPRTAGTVSEYLDRWLEGKRPNVAARTHRRWQSLADNQVKPRIGAKLLRDVKPRDLRALYADLQSAGLSGTTIHKVHSLLNMAFRQAVIDGDLPLNPCAAVAAPKTDTPEATALDEKQAKALLDALTDSPLYVPVLVTLDCGLRRGELLALRWQDVDLDAGAVIVRGAVEEDGPDVRIRETKTGRVRTVRLTGRATAALVVHRRQQAASRLAMANHWVDQGLVFPAVDAHRGKLAGRIWRPSSFSRVFREQTRAAGFTIGLHALRHTQATVMLRAGVSPKVVSERLGHATTRMTEDTYQHVLPDHQQAAVEAYEARMEEAGGE
jgi:integrase